MPRAPGAQIPLRGAVPADDAHRQARRHGGAGDDAGAVSPVPAHPDLRAPRLARPAGVRARARRAADGRASPSRLLLNYNAADLTLEGAFLAGLIAGPYAGALVGVLVGVPALLAGEFIALPFAVGCGFAGRRPARGVPEGSDLAVHAVRLRRPAQAPLADGAEARDRTGSWCCCSRRSRSSCCARRSASASARSGSSTSGSPSHRG